VELRAAPEVALAAIGGDGKARPFAAPTLWRDRSFVMQSIRLHGASLAVADVELRRYREVVLTAVWLDVWERERAADELRLDRFFLVQCVSRYGNSLKFAPDSVRHQCDFIVAAVSQHTASAVSYMTDGLRRDREVVLFIVKRGGQLLQRAAPERQHDREVVLVVVASSGWALR